MKLIILLLVVGSALGQFPGFNVPKFSAPKLDVPNVGDIQSFLLKEFGDFKTTFNKTYKSVDEEVFRKNNYLSNRNNVEAFNKLYEQGKKTFVEQLNPFSDLLNSEFNKLFNGLNRNLAKKKPLPKSLVHTKTAAQLPENVDWREKGAVTPVKYQGECACCYAFSAAGALEAQNFKKTGVLQELSPKNIMDCSQPLGNEGCDGGYIDTSFAYVKESGITNEDSYKFEAKTDKCAVNPQTIVANCSGYVEIPSGDEEALRDAVARVGPVSAGIDAGQESFQHYGKGVYYDEKCKNALEDLNHAVLIVGYGVEPDGQKYWLVKNTYSDKWGDGGYVKIAREKNNQCGIATQAFYPIV